MNSYRPTLKQAVEDLDTLDHQVMGTRFIENGKMSYVSYADSGAFIAHNQRMPPDKRHMCEMIREDAGSKIYADVEWDNTAKDKQAHKQPSKKDFLEAMCEYFSRFMKKHYGVKVD